MLTIAVVDDDNVCVQQISDFIVRSCEDKHISYTIKSYCDGKDFLDSYKKQFDVIFLDISMKQIDGLSTAARIRKSDNETLIIFFTQMAQYAIEGYKVNALDFLVKPLDYYSFELVFRKTLKQLKKKQGGSVALEIENGLQIIQQKNIYYVDIYKHYLTYHTSTGDYTVRGTLEDAKKKLDTILFYQCHRCYLVNISMVTSISKDSIQIDGRRIEVSRSRREGLVHAVKRYIVGGEE